MRLRPRIVEVIDPSLKLEAGNRVFTSLEGENPGGSMKDHMVFGELDALIRSKRLSKNGGVAEVSAGSTALSLAHYCRDLGVKCVLFVPTGIAEDTVNNLKKQGATVYQEDITLIYSAFDIFMQSHPELIAFDQLYDVSKRRHYNEFGRMIQSEVGPLNAVIGGVGTGHSLLGIAEGCGPDVQIVSAEPESFKVPGVRNILVDRYGEKDSLNTGFFDQRITIAASQFRPADTILTNVGTLKIGTSFCLVLEAVREYLKDKTYQNIFAISSSAKIDTQSVVKKVA